MRIYIHPDYRYMASFVKRVPKGEYTVDKVFCNKRNKVELTTILGRKFVIKKYKTPNFFNCLIYSFFRKSKCRRAYEHAIKLLDKGIETPFPVAYIEEKKNGIFHTGYFISCYMPYKTMNDIRIEDFTTEELYAIRDNLVEFVVDLNDKGVMPLDFNRGNVFIYRKPNDSRFRFALTDINRMRFGKLLGFKDTMRGFEQFGISTEHVYGLMMEYSLKRNVDVDYTMFIFLFFRLRNKLKRLMKKKCKNAFVNLKKHKA